MSEDQIQIRQRSRDTRGSDEDTKPSSQKEKKSEDVGPSSVTDKHHGSIKPKKRKRKDENLTCSRLIAYLMISPTIFYIISVLYGVIARYSFTGKIYHVAAAIIGAVIVTSLCVYFHKVLQAYLKYLAAASLLVFLIPTVQVFNCSPLQLDNSEIGTLFKLKENLDDFVKTAYHKQDCWKKQIFKTPYSMSLYTPGLKISIKPYQIIDLNMYHFDEKEESEDGPPPDSLPYPLYMFTSQRSVKRQMYNLNLLVMTPGRMRTIAEVLELNMDIRENVTLDVTGTLIPFGPKFDTTKKELEEMEFLLRPLVFHVQMVEVFGVPEEETENPEEYNADKSKWRKKEKNTRDKDDSSN